MAISVLQIWPEIVRKGFENLVKLKVREEMEGNETDRDYGFKGGHVDDPHSLVFTGFILIFFQSNYFFF